MSPRENSCAAEARSKGPEKDDNMLMSDGLLRVFWPYDLPRSSSPGVIVGWRNSELDLFVLTVLEDVEVSGFSLKGHVVLRNSILIARFLAIAAQCRQCAPRWDSLSE